MPFLIFWSGSFAVQYRDHLRSGIICGPIWGSFAVRDHLRSWDHLRTRTVWLVASKSRVTPIKRQTCRDRKRVLLPFLLRDCNNRLFVLKKKKKIELRTDKIDLGENTTTCTDKVKNKKSGENLQTWEFPLSASTSSRQKWRPCQDTA